MKNSLWKFATAGIVLTMLAPALVMLLAGCEPEVTPTPAPAAPPTDTLVPSKVEGETEGLVPPTAPPPYPGLVIDKWALWADGPHLRGANIYQRRVYLELDGPEFMGPGPVGPPYIQEDFNR